MRGKQETFASFGPSRVKKTAASITGIVDFVSWYRDEPSLKFVQPDVPIHQRPDLSLADLIGNEARVTISDTQFCTECGHETGGSLCSNCTGEPPHTACVMHPAKHCQYSNCPYPEYKERSCSHTHIVYLAATDKVKVGISRESRARCRWAEQGASHAIPIARAPNRKAAGIIERSLGDEWPQKHRQKWYQPMDNSIHRLVDDAFAASDLIPEKLKPCFLWEDATRDEVHDAVVTLPSIEAPALDNRLISTLYMLNAGESREGRILGVRGGLVATDEFVVNLKGHSGRRITLEMEDPFFEDTDLRGDTDKRSAVDKINPSEDTPVTKGEKV